MKEKELFVKFNRLNPEPGVPHPEYQEKLKNHSFRYFIPAWLKSCDEGYYVSHKKNNP